MRVQVSIAWQDHEHFLPNSEGVPIPLPGERVAFVGDGVSVALVVKEREFSFEPERGLVFVTLVCESALGPEGVERG